MSLLENVPSINENQVGYPVKQFVNNPTNWTKIFVIASVAFLLLGAYLWRQRTVLSQPSQLSFEERVRQLEAQWLSKISHQPIPSAITARMKRLRATHYLPYEDGVLIWWENIVLRKQGISLLKVTKKEGGKVEKEGVSVADCAEEFKRGAGCFLKKHAIALTDVPKTRLQTSPS